MRQQGSILVGLLWCLALLSVIVIGVLYTARMDLLVVKNYGDRIQAHYLALAGIEKAKALLYHDAKDRSRSRKNHSGDLYDAAAQFQDVPLGRGIFRVIRRARPDEGGGVIFGISDEESRLNVNTASADMLAKLQGMTPDTATAIVNWRGNSSAMAAEAQYYAGMQPPYQPRNGPLQTVRELLMVRGVTREAFLGRDLHQNGMLAVASEGGFAMAGSVDAAELGWAGVLTVDSTVQNVNAAGEDRVNIQSADQTALTALHGVTPQMASAIVAYRGQHRFESIADLLEVTPAQGRNSTGRSGTADNSDAGQPGTKMVSEDVFADLADDVTADSNQSIPGAININTAGLEVLVCLPGMSRELAQAVISQRQSNGFFASTGELLKVPGLTRDLFKQMAPLVTARSETFRILSEGKVNSTGARQRIQAIVQVGLNDIKTLSWREDDL